MANIKILSSELRAKLDALDETTARQRAEKAESVWRGLLIDEDGPALTKAEAELKDARFALERVQATRSALSTALDEAVAREKRERLDADRAAVDAEVEQVASLLKADYLKTARKLADILRRVKACDSRVLMMNLELSRAGRDDMLEYAEKRTLAAHDEYWTEGSQIWKRLDASRIPYA